MSLLGGGLESSIGAGISGGLIFLGLIAFILYVWAGEPSLRGSTAAYVASVCFVSVLAFLYAASQLATAAALAASDVNTGAVGSASSKAAAQLAQAPPAPTAVVPEPTIEIPVPTIPPIPSFTIPPIPSIDIPSFTPFPIPSFSPNINELTPSTIAGVGGRGESPNKAMQGALLAIVAAAVFLFHARVGLQMLDEEGGTDG
jgi:hypothetical protein